NVVEKLQLNLSVFEKKKPLDIDLYSESPVTLEYSGPDSLSSPPDTQLVIKVLSSTKFSIEGRPEVEINFGAGLPVADGLLTIGAAPDKFERYVGRELLIRLAGSAKVSSYYTSRLKVFAVNNKAN